MARVSIPITEVKPRQANAVNASGTGWAFGQASSDYEWVWQPGDILVICNLAASTPTFTVVRPENRYGRGMDYTSPTIGQFAMRLFRPRTADGWVDASTGKISIDTTSDDLRFAVLRPNPPMPAS
jgi:hypothetical protein